MKKTYLFNLLVQNHHGIMYVGNAGTGKTVCMQNNIKKLDEDEYEEGEELPALTYRQVARKCMKGWDTGTEKFLYKNYVNYHFRSKEEQEEDMRKACEAYKNEKKSGCLL